MSLPGIFGTTLDTIPANVPYLTADPDRVERWRHELEPAQGLKIGFTWQGRPTHPRDTARSFPLAVFAPLAELRGVRLVALQVGEGRDQLASFTKRWPLVDVGDRLDDFSDTAAVIQNLDLVIACDSAVAHLAGALGRPAWVALPFVPDWRWLLDREDSPWYPTVRRFRQTTPGDWAGVFARILDAVRERVGIRTGSTNPF
jgi:hypothetical protein